MHEAGIAAALVAVLREHEGSWSQGRILVRGGHADADAFDRALLFHLEAAGAASALARLEVVHVSTDLVCTRCGRGYTAMTPTALCPSCSGAPWPALSAEKVELELDSIPRSRAEGESR